MDIGKISSFGSILSGNETVQKIKMNEEKSKFQDLISRMQNKNSSSDTVSTLSSSQINSNGKLNGDYSTGFENSFTSESDKNALAKGAAANQSNAHVQPKKIDKTSKLYEKSLELESYFVKQMLSAMRKTVSKSALASNDFAGEMYEDMLFDEYSTSMTKNAGFGLADQIYLSLV